MLSRSEEAKLLGVSERTLRRWRASGKVPATPLSQMCWCGGLALLTACGREELSGGNEGLAYEGLCLSCGAFCREVRPI
jgi:hypothetical protein